MQLQAEGTGREEPSLVRQLLCAAVHSRAAYGYAMAAGHMSSLLKFALMYTVSLQYPLLGLMQLILMASFTCIIVFQGLSAWSQCTKTMVVVNAASSYLV